MGLAALFLIGGSSSVHMAIAESDTRTLSFHHIHTGEDLTVTFKRNGRYDDDALKKLDWFMRDWRRDEPTRMDPQLFDILWEAYREVGGTQPIQVIGGFRSPETNSMLYARSNGVAKFSQHTDGKAMDFYIPGVPLEAVRNIGLRMQRGGVGFYPSSSDQFVHLDTGSIRHWPRLSHEQLAKLFPDGRTVHIPSDGKPLAQYALALADVERRGDAPSSISLTAARRAGAIGEDPPSENKPRNLLASLFGFGTRDTVEFEERDKGEPLSVAAPKPVATERIVPVPPSRPALVTVAALTETESVNTPALRGAVSAAASLPPPEKPADAIVTAAFTNADRIADAPLMAYAPPAAAAAAKKASPMGTAIALPRVRPASLGQTAALGPAPDTESSFAGAHADPPADPMSGGGLAGPWLRALIVTPSARHFMTTTRFGAPDPIALSGHMRAPASSLMLTFAAGPVTGPATDRFGGEAVVFLAATRFTDRTVALSRK